MESLLIVKQQLTRFYTRFEAYIVPVLKFLAMLMALLLIGNSVGFMSKLKNPAIVLILSLLCSFLPTNVIVLAAGFVIVAHMYALSLECAIVVLFIFIIILNLSLASWAAFNVLLELKKNLTELPKCNLLYSSIISQASIKSITVTSDNSHQQT